MFTYMKLMTPLDRRSAMLVAGLAVLREEGLAGFTQPMSQQKLGFDRET
jgi:hypothetical protein